MNLANPLGLCSNQRVRTVREGSVRGLFWVVLVLLSAMATFVAVFVLQGRRPKTQTGPIPHEVYVWQRAWDTNVTAAARQATAQVAGFTVLAAEVAWPEGQPKTARVKPDYRALKATGRPIGLALRIGPCPGRLTDTARFIPSLANSAIQDARAAGLEPAEFQIDYDCAESRIDEYARCIAQIRRSLGGIPLTITALPSWLDQPAFHDLASATDGYVLQVHSLQPPRGRGSDFTLCDPSAAKRWVRAADRFGVPFRVALPTYGYIAGFSPDGRLSGVSAEGPAVNWAADVKVRRLSADPLELARLVRDWEASRPLNMRGIIWYRLPVRTDMLNWKWSTLSAIIGGRSPRQNLSAEVRVLTPVLCEIVLVNDGEVDQRAGFDIKVDWTGGKVVASDGLAGFTVEQTRPNMATLSIEGSAKDAWLIRAGQKQKVAWLRFDKESTVTAAVIGKDKS